MAYYRHFYCLRCRVSYRITFVAGGETVKTETSAGNEEIVLPQSLERIGDNAFRNCYALGNLNLSDCTGLKRIGEYAFSFCKAMTRMYIPVSVTELGEGVFNQIPGITVDIGIESSQVPATWSEDWNFTYADTPIVINWGVKNA